MCTLLPYCPGTQARTVPAPITQAQTGGVQPVWIQFGVQQLHIFRAHAQTAPIPLPRSRKKEANNEVIEEAVEVTVLPDETRPDQLTKIEGIGPKIQEICYAAGIKTFAQLAAKTAKELNALLQEAGPRYNVHDPKTWPMQAKMAADGDWDGLKKWQDELKGGK